VLYCARHTFGTAAYGATGNLAMVMNVMGNTDVRTAMRYQHPVLDSVREAIDQRNLRHKPRHNELRRQLKWLQVMERIEPTIRLELMTCRLRNDPTLRMLL